VAVREEVRKAVREEVKKAATEEARKAVTKEVRKAVTGIATGEVTEAVTKRRLLTKAVQAVEMKIRRKKPRRKLQAHQQDPLQAAAVVVLAAVGQIPTRAEQLYFLTTVLSFHILCLPHLDKQFSNWAGTRVSFT
jgi:uncharacterized protein (UPF0218 family)